MIVRSLCNFGMQTWLNIILTFLPYSVNIQVDAYEVKKQELMQENTDLKALLRSMQVITM
jgi:hypothetical protein